MSSDAPSLIRGGRRHASGGTRARRGSSRRWRATSLRTRSVSRREATVISQPRGLSGTPSSGHCRDAASSASWTASSQASNWPYRRASAPRTCGASSRSRPSMSRVGSPGPVGCPAPCRVGRGHISAPASSMSRPDLDDAVLRQRVGDLLCTVEAVDVDEEQPGELLLDLAERPVGHGRGAVPELDERALVAEALDPDQLAARLGLVDHLVVIAKDAVDLFLERGSPARTACPNG